MRVGVILMSVASLALSGSAAAQSIFPSRLKAPDNTVNADYMAMAALRDFSGCMAASHGADVRAFIQAPPGTPADASARQKLFGRPTTCMRFVYKLKASAELIRGALSEAMYKREFTGGANWPTVPATGYDAAVAAGKLPAAGSGLAEVTQCVALSRPADVHALLMTTKMGTEEELAGFRKIEDAIGPCVPANVRVALDPMSLRVSLAQSMYRLATANAGGGSVR